MAESDNGTILANFLAITGTESSYALSILEANAWNLEQSVNMALSLQSEQPSANAQPATRTNPPVPPSYLPQEEEEEEVRAPLPTQRQRLVQPSARGFKSSSVAGSAPARSAFRDFEAEGRSPSSSSSKTSGAQRKEAPNLASLFAPPQDLLFRGTFQEARASAREQQKWLLVNIQCDTEFASHQLNRDTWSDETLKGVVKEMFIFWQQDNSSNEGKHYETRYHVSQLPHIALVDPRTGGESLRRSGFIEGRDLVSILCDFCEKNTLKISDASSQAQATASFVATASCSSQSNSAESGTGRVAAAANGRDHEHNSRLTGAPGATGTASSQASLASSTSIPSQAKPPAGGQFAPKAASSTVTKQLGSSDSTKPAQDDLDEIRRRRLARFG